MSMWIRLCVLITICCWAVMPCYAGLTAHGLRVLNTQCPNGDAKCRAEQTKKIEELCAMRRETVRKDPSPMVKLYCAPIIAMCTDDVGVGAGAGAGGDEYTFDGGSLGDMPEGGGHLSDIPEGGGHLTGYDLPERKMTREEYDRFQADQSAEDIYDIAIKQVEKNMAELEGKTGGLDKAYQSMEDVYEVLREEVQDVYENLDEPYNEYSQEVTKSVQLEKERLLKRAVDDYQIKIKELDGQKVQLKKELRQMEAAVKAKALSVQHRHTFTNAKIVVQGLILVSTGGVGSLLCQVMGAGYQLYLTSQEVDGLKQMDLTYKTKKRQLEENINKTIAYKANINLWQRELLALERKNYE